jgi:hypothetical protein
MRFTHYRQAIGLFLAGAPRVILLRKVQENRNLLHGAPFNLELGPRLCRNAW